MLRKWVTGYITVEASLLVPYLLMVLILPIYWTFYMYNKCVIFQDCYIAALRGSQVQGTECDRTEDIVRNSIEQLLENQLYRYQIDPKINIDNGYISVSAETKMDIVAAPVIQSIYKSLGSVREAKCKVIDPVILLREVY